MLCINPQREGVLCVNPHGDGVLCVNLQGEGVLCVNPHGEGVLCVDISMERVCCVSIPMERVVNPHMERCQYPWRGLRGCDVLYGKGVLCVNTHREGFQFPWRGCFVLYVNPHRGVEEKWVLQMRLCIELECAMHLSIV